MNKVVLLAPTPPPVGGIAQWTMRMLKARLKNDWQVEVVDEKILGNREFFGDNVKYDIGCEIRRCLNIWNGLRKQLRDPSVRVVHSCNPANTMPVLRECICGLITKLYRRKFIIHFRCTVPNMVTGRLNRLAVKLICDLSDCVMVLNQQSADFIRTLSAVKIQLIPNFVEEGEITGGQEIREELRQVVYVGGVIPSKGCLDLIEVAKRFPDIQFRLVGSADREVKAAAQGLENVILTGPKNKEEVKRELQAADVFAFLSYFSGEGFSNSLTEAMAMGLPCLVTDWAANKDMVGEEGGFVVPVGDVAAAVRALEAMGARQVRQRQSAYNVEKVRRCYAEQVVIDQYVDTYEAVLK